MDMIRLIKDESDLSPHCIFNHDKGRRRGISYGLKQIIMFHLDVIFQKALSNRNDHQIKASVQKAI